MAKFSVHVPDDLWDQVRAGARDRNTSQLVQQGLRKLVADEQGDPSYAGRPEGADERIHELERRLAAEARVDYERGYTIALDAASAMPLRVINDLVDAGFDLERWLGPWKRRWMYDLTEHSEPVPVEEVNRFLEEVSRGERSQEPPPHDESWRNDENWYWWLWKSAEALGTIADPIDRDEYSFTPTVARQRGFIDAMRDLWDALEHGRPRSDAGSDEPRGDGRRDA